MKCELAPKWTEEKLVNAMHNLSSLCVAGTISWNEKESALVNLLNTAGWTWAELYSLGNN